MKKNQLFIAVVFLFAVIAVSPYLINGNIDPAVVKGAQSITRDVTGTVWTCVRENTYQWKHVYDDGTIETIDRYINAESINCDSFYWSCENDNNLCDSYNIDHTCTCRQQLTTAELGSSN